MSYTIVQLNCAVETATKRLREELASAQEAVQKLQCALNFWMPAIPENCQNEQLVHRIMADAELLCGYEGEMVDTAEELGWIQFPEQREPGQS